MKICLKSPDAGFLTAEGGGGGNLTCRAVIASDREYFFVRKADQMPPSVLTLSQEDWFGEPPLCTTEINSGDFIYLETYNGHFISAVGENLLTADGNVTDPSTRFQIMRAFGDGPIVYGDFVWLRAANGKIVYGGGESGLRANVEIPGGWTTFLWSDDKNQPLTLQASSIAPVSFDTEDIFAICGRDGGVYRTSLNAEGNFPPPLWTHTGLRAAHSGMSLSDTAARRKIEFDASNKSIASVDGISSGERHAIIFAIDVTGQIQFSKRSSDGNWSRWEEVGHAFEALKLAAVFTPVGAELFVIENTVYGRIWNGHFSFNNSKCNWTLLPYRDPSGHAAYATDIAAYSTLVGANCGVIVCASRSDASFVYTVCGSSAINPDNPWSYREWGYCDCRDLGGLTSVSCTYSEDGRSWGFGVSKIDGKIYRFSFNNPSQGFCRLDGGINYNVDYVTSGQYYDGSIILLGFGTESVCAHGNNGDFQTFSRIGVQLKFGVICGGSKNVIWSDDSNTCLIFIKSDGILLKLPLDKTSLLAGLNVSDVKSVPLVPQLLGPKEGQAFTLTMRRLNIPSSSAYYQAITDERTASSAAKISSITYLNDPYFLGSDQIGVRLIHPAARMLNSDIPGELVNIKHLVPRNVTNFEALRGEWTKSVAGYWYAAFDGPGPELPLVLRFSVQLTFKG